MRARCISTTGAVSTVPCVVQQSVLATEDDGGVGRRDDRRRGAGFLAGVNVAEIEQFQLTVESVLCKGAPHIVSHHLLARWLRGPGAGVVDRGQVAKALWAGRCCPRSASPPPAPVPSAGW